MRFFPLTRDFILESQLVEPHELPFQNITKDKEKNMFYEKTNILMPLVGRLEYFIDHNILLK